MNNTKDMNNELFMEWYYKLFILTYGEIDDEYILNSFRTILAWKKGLIFISEDIPEDIFTVNEYWLLLSLLHECIEYGTSPRGAWLSSFGEKVFEFLSENTNEDILNYYEE